MGILNNLIQRVSSLGKSVILPESNDPRIIEAAVLSMKNLSRGQYCAEILKKSLLILKNWENHIQALKL